MILNVNLLQICVFLMMKCVQLPTPVQTHFNGSWGEVSPNHNYRVAPSFRMINSLEFDESWSRSQCYGQAYPVRSKEVMLNKKRIFGTSSQVLFAYHI
jgi:hypothetical protein